MGWIIEPKFHTWFEKQRAIFNSFGRDCDAEGLWGSTRRMSVDSVMGEYKKGKATLSDFDDLIFNGKLDQLN